MIKSGMYLDGRELFEWELLKLSKVGYIQSKVETNKMNRLKDVESFEDRRIEVLSE